MVTIDITTLGVCDVKECGATAYVEAGGLWFCAHHFRDNEVALRIAGLDIIDHRDQLTGNELRERPAEAPKALVPYHYQGRHEGGPGYTAEDPPEGGYQGWV
jgi:hypothetical protein